MPKVVAADPFETEAGTFEVVALEEEDSSYVQWNSEGLGVVELSENIECFNPSRQLVSYELDSD